MSTHTYWYALKLQKPPVALDLQSHRIRAAQVDRQGEAADEVRLDGGTAMEPLATAWEVINNIKRVVKSNDRYWENGI